MDLELQEVSGDEDSTYLYCLQAIVEEQNPFTYLDLHDSTQEHMRAWIREQCCFYHYGHETHTFWIKYEQEVVGIATIKKQLSEALFADSGHIGLCIRKPYRHKGIGTKALQELIQEVRLRYAVQDILLCCSYDNIVSRKLCQKVGGIQKHEDSFVHYWISEHAEDVFDV